VTNTPCRAEKTLRIRLRELRKQAGLTQEAFAERAKFSYKYYQGIERGQWTNLRLRTLEKLAKGYGITLAELFIEAKKSKE
jgi:transcriptional regulator with XRE-family HTH domain